MSAFGGKADITQTCCCDVRIRPIGDIEPQTLADCADRQNALDTARKIHLTTYICSRTLKEAHMLMSRACLDPPAWSIGSSLVTLDLPPKDPDDDDDEDEEDDEDEGEEEPAVVREPDE